MSLYHYVSSMIIHYAYFSDYFMFNIKEITWHVQTNWEVVWGASFFNILNPIMQAYKSIPLIKKGNELQTMQKVWFIPIKYEIIMPQLNKP